MNNDSPYQKPIPALIASATKSTLTQSESDALARCEGVITDHLGAILVVGEALSEIRESRLYREKFDTFDAYLAATWQWSRQHVSRLILGAEVAADLSPIGDATHLTESQCRPLTRLSAPDRREAFAAAQASSGLASPPARVIKAAAEAVKPKPPLLYRFVNDETRKVHVGPVVVVRTPIQVYVSPPAGQEAAERRAELLERATSSLRSWRTCWREAIASFDDPAAREIESLSERLYDLLSTLADAPLGIAGEH